MSRKAGRLALRLLAALEGGFVATCQNGHRSPEHQQFCGECGLALPGQVATCQNGHSNPADNQFCAECGAPMRAVRHPSEGVQANVTLEPRCAKTGAPGGQGEGPAPTRQPPSLGDRSRIAARSADAGPGDGASRPPTRRTPPRWLLVSGAAALVLAVGATTAVVIAHRDQSSRALGGQDGRTGEAKTSPDVHGSQPWASTPPSLAPSPAATPPGDGEIEFQSPSGNIACRISPTGAACDIRSYHYLVPPEPNPVGCQLYGDRLELDAGGPGSLACHTGTFLGRSLPTQAYDTPLSSGQITCEISEQAGVTCRDTLTRHFFRLSQQSYDVA